MKVSSSPFHLEKCVLWSDYDFLLKFIYLPFIMIPPYLKVFVCEEKKRKLKFKNFFFFW